MNRLPVRKNIRFKGYDYSSSGWYFITICSFERQCIFGNIVGAHHDAPAKMTTTIKLSKAGIIIKDIWESLAHRFLIDFDVWQIMPNHLHGIIIIKSFRAIHKSPLQNKRSKRSLLSKIIGYFKMNSTKQIRNLNNDPNYPVWQRGYYDHIIRNEKSLNEIRKYIQLNPLLWERDRNNPKNIV